MREFFASWFNRYRWRYLWCDLRDWFFPRQRWLTRSIPKSWCDKTELIPLTVFDCLIHFVEEEKGLEVLRYQVEEAQQNPEHYENSSERVQECQEVYVALDSAYTWAKERVQFEEETWQQIPEGKLHDSLSYYEYREDYRLDKDMFHLQNIIRYHRYMWT